jgi:hypothetical protein
MLLSSTSLSPDSSSFIMPSFTVAPLSTHLSPIACFMPSLPTRKSSVCHPPVHRPPIVCQRPIVHPPRPLLRRSHSHHPHVHRQSPSHPPPSHVHCHVHMLSSPACLPSLPVICPTTSRPPPARRHGWPAMGSLIWKEEGGGRGIFAFSQQIKN